MAKRRFRATVLWAENPRLPADAERAVFEADTVADVLGAIARSLELESAESVEITVRPLSAFDA